jgi:hypothetical protein
MLESHDDTAGSRDRRIRRVRQLLTRLDELQGGRFHAARRSNAIGRFRERSTVRGSRTLLLQRHPIGGVEDHLHVAREHSLLHEIEATPPE